MSLRIAAAILIVAAVAGLWLVLEDGSPPSAPEPQAPGELPAAGRPDPAPRKGAVGVSAPVEAPADIKAPPGMRLVVGGVDVKTAGASAWLEPDKRVPPPGDGKGVSPELRRRIEEEGLMGRPSEWAKTRFGPLLPAGWGPDAAAMANAAGGVFDQAVHYPERGIKLGFKYKGDQVVYVKATFDPMTSSPDDLNLAMDLVFGDDNDLELPFGSTEMVPTMGKSGTVTLADGTTVYFRGQTRMTGEGPYGAEQVELSTAPLD